MTPFHYFDYNFLHRNDNEVIPISWNLDFKNFPTIYYTSQLKLWIKSYRCSKLSCLHLLYQHVRVRFDTSVSPCSPQITLLLMSVLQGNTSVSNTTCPCCSTFPETETFDRATVFVISGQHVRVTFDTSVCCSVGIFVKFVLIFGNYKYFLRNIISTLRFSYSLLESF